MLSSLACLSAFMTLAPASPSWTLEQLNAALEQHSYAEILDRATDVPSTERTDGWQDAVTKSAAEVLRAMKPTEKSPLFVVNRATELAVRFRFIESRPEFVAARGEVIVAALRRCWDADDQRCLRALDAHTQSLSGKAALDAAKVLQRGGVPWGAMSYIERAVASERTLCTNALVRTVTLSALTTPADQPVAASARRVAFELCWDALMPATKEGMVGASDAYLQNCCKAMRDKGALSGLQDEICLDEDL